MKKRTSRSNPVSSGLTKGQYQAVKKIVEKQAELKHFDQGGTGTGMPTAGSIIALTSITQGDASDNREGNKVNVKSVQFKCFIRRVATDSSARVILFQFLRPVPGTNPATADLVVTSGSMISPVKANTASFRILMDKRLPTMTAENPSYVVEYFKRMNFSINFVDGTAANWSRNPLFLYLISDNAGNNPLIDFTCRIRFTDS